MTYILLAIGLVILVFGADVLVRGSVALASLAGVSPLIIGLTVVAFGTSAPELAVTSVSSMKGESAIALGNVIGSNICNILLILGLSAVIVPLSVSSQLVRLDVPMMIAASVGAWICAYDGSIMPLEGVAMLIAFTIYTVWMIRKGRKEETARRIENEALTNTFDQTTISGRSIVMSFLFVIVGLAMLVVGAQMLVDSATTIAKTFGVSDMVIGLTIVAVGTSLPELATSVVAASRGQRDLAVGNAVGSNLFNLLIVLAAASILAPAGVPVDSSVLWFDFVVMVVVALLCWPIFLSGGEVSRIEGIVMLALFVGYTALLIADSLKFEDAPLWKNIYGYGALPLLLVIVSVIAWRGVFASPPNSSPAD